MKKYITLIITMFIMLSARAESLEASFSKAIRNGRSNNGTGSYTIQFDNKNVTVDDVLLFMGKKGYILTESYTTKRMMKFGEYVKAMGTVKFITKSELESFIANTYSSNTMGKAVIYPNSQKETVDVYWSNSVINGRISGNGIGYTKLNNKIMYIIRGKFSDGIPDGTCEVVTATPSIIPGTVSRLDKTDRKSTNYHVGSLSNGYRSFQMNGKYGFINERGDFIASCIYGNVVQEFSNDGYAIVTDPSDGDQEIKINTNGTKLGYSDRQLKINEEKRLAKIAEEKRLAEEKRQKELNERENKMYNDIVSKSQNMEDSYNKMSEYLRTFTNGIHYDEVLSLKNTLDVRLKETENNKNSKKWSKGDKICYWDMNNGLVCGVLESLSGGKAKLKIISGHIYNNQNTMTIKGEPMYKDKEIWIGLKDGWHLATDGDFNELANYDNLMVGNSGDVNSPVASGKGGSKPSSFVDLGLSSGTLWAKWNVGASSPEDGGDEFAWSATKPGGNQSQKYTRAEQVLEEYDDAATVNWGKKWRTPTAEEWRELREYCKQEFKTQNGVNGCLVTGPNGNSIFLPTHNYMSATMHGNLGSRRTVYYNSIQWNPGWNRQFYVLDGYDFLRFYVRPVLKYTKDELIMMSIENQLGN